jgi:hypothetical protein
MNMGIKACRLLGAIGIFISMVSSTCKCRTGCADLQYAFDINCRAYPDNDSFELGDTIWVEINAPTHLQDKVSGKNIDYGGAVNLGTAIDFLEIKAGTVSTPGSIPAAHNFDYYLVEGNLVTKNTYHERVKEFTFVKMSGHYSFKAGFIPQKKGEFIIAPGNAANVYRENDKCTKASFSITFKDTDQHLYLYEQSRPGYTPSVYERTHMYCFKVY